MYNYNYVQVPQGVNMTAKCDHDCKCSEVKIKILSTHELWLWLQVLTKFDNTGKHLCPTELCVLICTTMKTPVDKQQQPRLVI